MSSTNNNNTSTSEELPVLKRRTTFDDIDDKVTLVVGANDFDDYSDSDDHQSPAAMGLNKKKTVFEQMTPQQMALNFGLVGVSCTVAQASVHWTQSTMVRQQLIAAKTNIEPSFFEAAKQLYGMGGIQGGLYKGFSAAACREVIYSSLRFGLYEPIKVGLGAKGRDTPVWMNVTAGLAAGTIAAGIASPTDLLMIRMMSDTSNPPLTLRQTASSILKQSGVRGMYLGIDTTIIRAAILGGTKMGCYDTVKQELRRRYDFKDGTPSMIFIASMITGLAVTATTSPATNAKTLIMSSPPGTYNGIVHCLSDIAKKQGPMGLFRGFGAQWARIGPYAMVQFTMWEKLRSLCGMRPI